MTTPHPKLLPCPWHSTYQKDCAHCSHANAHLFLNAISATSTPPAAPVAEDAVSAMVKSLYDIGDTEITGPEKRQAERLINRLSAQGYTLRRETMTEAELEVEIKRIVFDYFEPQEGQQFILPRKELFDLAKKFRG